MAVITPVSPAVAGSVITTATPGTDSIPCAQYNVVFLVIWSVSTGAPTLTIADPTSQAPAGLAFTASSMTVAVTAAQRKVVRLDCGRWRDVNGNINYTTATAGDALVFAVGI